CARGGGWLHWFFDVW
nr:immunoglobulin heavy chain junction region [Mus musculus]